MSFQSPSPRSSSTQGGRHYWTFRRPAEEAHRRLVRPGPANYNTEQGEVRSVTEVGAHAQRVAGVGGGLSVR